MVEYGKSNTVSLKKERATPTVIFGISFGEVSYLDYKPDTKLKVKQEDLLIFFIRSNPFIDFVKETFFPSNNCI